MKRPLETDANDYFNAYIQQVEADDILQFLRDSGNETAQMIAKLGEEQVLHRYAEGKWSIKEILGHLTDAERVLQYRGLRFARGDRTELAGFEENDYVEAAHFDRRPLGELIADFESVRASSVRLWSSLSDEDLAQQGTANGTVITAGALPWVIAGHEVHHRQVIRQRYL